MAKSDYFMKIDGIAGESKDSQHTGAIDVESYSFGATQTGTFAFGGGGGAGKVQFQDFHFNSKVSKASPKLYLACANGEHIAKAVLTCRKAGGGKQEEFLKVTLSELMVTSYQIGQQAGVEVPLEQVSLNFARIEYEYKEQKADGSLGGSIKAGWDLKAGKKL
jgi:type VI secretion system secreted protein Hcp